MNNQTIIFKKPDGSEPLVCVDCSTPLEYVKDPPHVHPGQYHFLYCRKCPAYYKATHEGKFMSAPADRETRRWRSIAHGYFDKLAKPAWRHDEEYKTLLERCGRNRARTMTRLIRAHRRYAYQWLAERMGLPKNGVHIGLMNIAQCKNVIAICEGATSEMIKEWHMNQKRPKPRKRRAGRCHDIEELE